MSETYGEHSLVHEGGGEVGMREDGIHYDEVGRPEPPTAGDELATLVGHTDFLRATLAWKCEGLDDDALRVTLGPSPMTLGGILTHLAFVEDYWFSLHLAGTMPEPWASADWDADPDWDWHMAAAKPGREIRALWESAVARSREALARYVAGTGPVAEWPHEAALAAPLRRHRSDDVFTLRWLLTHFVEEYGRHCGHTDLIRESIDGARGE